MANPFRRRYRWDVRLRTPHSRGWVTITGTTYTQRGARRQARNRIERWVAADG